MKIRKLAVVLASALVGSCKTSVNVGYDISELKKFRVPVSIIYELESGCKPIEVREVANICEDGRASVYVEVEGYDKVENLSIVNPAHLFLSADGTLIAYLSKELRDEIVIRYGDTETVSRAAKITVIVTNRTPSIKSINIQGSWVNGKPTSRFTGDMFYLREGESMNVTLPDVAVGNLLAGGLEVIASIK